MLRANVSVNVCPELQQRLLTEFEKRYKKPGGSRARTGEFIVHWQNRIDSDRSPSDQAVLNVLKGFFVTYYAKSIVKSVKSIEQICQNANQVLVRLDI